MSQNSPRPTNDRKPQKTAAPVQNDANEEEEAGSRFLLFNVMPSWMVSFLTHIAVIVVLAIMVMPPKKERTVALEAGEQAAEPLESIDMNFDALEFNTDEAFESEITIDEPTEVTQDINVTLPEVQVDIGNMLGAIDAFDADMMGPLNPSDMSEETSSRSGESKTRMLKEYGGTPASEESVALALKWIVKHQLEDGGWNLDHTRGPGNFRNSPNPGDLVGARAAATSLAILPLLGAGHTHLTGEYKENVRLGLEFLKKRAKRGGNRGISYMEPGGSMYSHGLTAIVFCEAFAMTKDPDLAPYAQASLWYIEYAQDPIGGGWRYEPKQPGDTSAVGWQLMALKSGKISGLAVNPKTYRLAEKFLDSVSTNGGAYYGYAAPPKGQPANACSAVGLLCRMYMGWSKNVPGMKDGVANIADRGPATKDTIDMYYNYYATQTMKHVGGPQWNKWNNKMRDFLVETQEKDGNKAGSWYFEQGHASEKGGRLYATSLACMTLEVYYRYLPLYGDSASNDEFPLD